jgi:hypothetical protein
MATTHPVSLPEAYPKTVPEYVEALWRLAEQAVHRPLTWWEQRVVREAAQILEDRAR